MTKTEAMQIIGERMRSKRLREKQIKEAEAALSAALAAYVKTMAQELIARMAENAEQ